ncbi:MAG: PEGA domain-containing protein [Polyangiaceae bacterium]
MRGVRSLFVAALAGAMLLPTPGSASPAALGADASPRARAAACYRRGVEAYRLARYKDAIDAFLEADALAPSAALSFDAALAYERLLDSAGALRFYRDYLRRAPQGDKAAQAEQRVRELSSQLSARGVQQLTVLSEPAGATLSVDGRALGVTPWTGELSPGPHRIALSLKRHQEATRDIELPKGNAIDVTVQLAAEPAPQPPQRFVAAPTPEPRATHGLGAWPWVALGASGAALGAAAGFELSRRAAESDAREQVTQTGYSERFDAMQSRQSTARVLAAVGGGLLLTSGVLFLVDSRKSRESTSAAVAFAPGQGFVTLRGGF